MTEDKVKLKRYEVALETRNFEIELFWKRSLFFWGFIASAFVGYATLVRAESSLSVVLACFGLVCSFSWSLVNRGSKRWQENWELFVSNLEHDVTGRLFSERREKVDQPFWLSASKFSVSKVTIALSDFTIIIWTLIIVSHITKVFPCELLSTEKSLVVSSVVITGLYVLAIYVFGKSRD